jgi:hypothetical protein
MMSLGDSSWHWDATNDNELAAWDWAASSMIVVLLAVAAMVFVQTSLFYTPAKRRYDTSSNDPSLVNEECRLVDNAQRKSAYV